MFKVFSDGHNGSLGFRLALEGCSMAQNIPGVGFSRNRDSIKLSMFFAWFYCGCFTKRKTVTETENIPGAGEAHGDIKTLWVFFPLFKLSFTE